LVSVLVIGTFGVMRLFKEADAPLPPPGAELSCTVAGIHDGDTLTARCDKGRIIVRVFGIDAPEMGQKPWGAYSRDLLRSMMPAGKVGLQVTDIDRYGRVVARVMDGGRDLGLSLVRQGGAVVYERYNKSKDYKRAQADAKRERVGVWSEPGAHQTPWQWRRLNPRG
jgi:endonuclease YncB( thermonuclease family)